MNWCLVTHCPKVAGYGHECCEEHSKLTSKDRYALERRIAREDKAKAKREA